jgi:hypothetical protein
MADDQLQTAACCPSVATDTPDCQQLTKIAIAHRDGVPKYESALTPQRWKNLHVTQRQVQLFVSRRLQGGAHQLGTWPCPTSGVCRREEVLV